MNHDVPKGLRPPCARPIPAENARAAGSRVSALSEFGRTSKASAIRLRPQIERPLWFGERVAN